ncbi:MAG: hypothetical protein HY819_13585 [Acidobacteria bacterium]|nr:hypothetical protein [Acidobacteriota bacterium]
MAVNNISNTLNSTNINSINNQNPQSQSTNSDAQSLSVANDLSLTREDVSLLGADFLKLRLQQSLPSQISNLVSSPSINTNLSNVATLSGGTTPTTPLNPSLNPKAVFDTQVNNFLDKTIGLDPSRIRTAQTVETVNSANVLQSSQIQFKNGGSATSFYTAGFPPTSTATLPRTIFDDQGVLSFYKGADPLNATQLQSVQNLYAGDLTSRKNYAANLGNLAKSLTTISNSGNLNSGLQGKVNSAINSLRTAYNTLSDVNAPAPSPRAIYAQVADAYRALAASSCYVNPAQRDMIDQGINILSIGASNYDTNRVPVAGTPITPAPQSPTTPAQAQAAGYPLANFDTLKNTPLTAAQANPAQVFGSDVNNYLKSIGLNNVNLNNIEYQVNSADKLQSITVPLGNGRNLTTFFNGGFPVPAATAPQVAFKGTTGARQYLDVAQNSAQTQQRLTNYYADPANAARRTNYGVNLQNLTTAFQQLQQAGNLSQSAKNQVQDALNTLQKATQQLNNGGLPNVLGTYQKLGDNLDQLACASLNQQQRSILNTLGGSLLPVGVQNYYLVPVSLTQQA